MAEGHDAKLVDEQADDDRRGAEQNVVDEANDVGDARVAAVFGEIGAGQNAQRRGDDQPDRRLTIRLPTIEFNRPPATPGGAVILVKTSSDRPPKPFQNSEPRIRTSQLSPKAVAA